MQTRLERLVQSIVDLGFATQDEVDALARDWSQSLFENEATFDDDSETGGFLEFLGNCGVLSSAQLRGLMAILQTGSASLQPVANEDPLVGYTFGDYLTGQKLGEGAMGRIYHAQKNGDSGPS